MSFDQDFDLTESKEFKKFTKQADLQQAQELIGKTDAELQDIIALQSVSIEEAVASTKATPEWIEAAETLKLLRSALNERNNPLKAAVALANLTLRSRK